MILIADRQITGDFGRVTPGTEFECDAATAAHLLDRNLAHRPAAPRVVYEVKVIAPEAPAVASEGPFRDVLVHHAEPPTVAPQGDSGMESADVPEQRTADTGRRRGRPRRNP